MLRSYLAPRFRQNIQRPDKRQCVSKIIRHEEVEVLGNTVLVAVTNEGNFVSPRHICEGIGINWPGQYKKIMVDEELKGTVEEMSTVRPDGSSVKTTMLPFELMTGWLFTIKPGKVKESVRAELKKFRAEAYGGLIAQEAMRQRDERIAG